MKQFFQELDRLKGELSAKDATIRYLSEQNAQLRQDVQNFQLNIQLLNRGNFYQLNIQLLNRANFYQLDPTVEGKKPNDYPVPLTSSL